VIDWAKIKKEITDLIILDLEGKTRKEALLNIAKFAKANSLVDDEQFLWQKFLEREGQGTTAIGNGLALPEACWIEMSRPYAFILCRTKEPVEFNSLDKKPVRIVLASLGRDKDDLSRLKPMAELARILMNNQFRQSFLKAKDVDEVYSLFEKGTKKK
jgi:mannitol/fructose-specific phosphotransferase system IIA component (Ntr-type)